MENNIPYASRDSVSRLFQRVEELEKNNGQRFIELDRRVTVTETLVESLKQLPDTLQSLELTLVKVQTSLENIGKSSAKMEKKIDSIDQKYDQRVDIVESEYKKEVLKIQKDVDKEKNRGKFDVIKFLTTHFWKILLCIIGGALVVKDLFIL